MYDGAVPPFGSSPGRWPGLLFALVAFGVSLGAAGLASGGPDQPPPRLRRSAVASAKAERAALHPVIVQSPDGRRVVTAAETRAPIALDGALDEEVWRAAEPAAEFVQAEPQEGQAATDPTEVRIAFDTDALYIGVICHDSAASALIVNDIRKDFTPGGQDTFEVILDTFPDRRNGFVFATNPPGAKRDAQIATEGREGNTSWTAVWTGATPAGPDGWSAQ